MGHEGGEESKKEGIHVGIFCFNFHLTFISQGDVVQEVRQVFSPWVTQVCGVHVMYACTCLCEYTYMYIHVCSHFAFSS